MLQHIQTTLSKCIYHNLIPKKRLCSESVVQISRVLSCVQGIPKTMQARYLVYCRVTKNSPHVSLSVFREDPFKNILSIPVDGNGKNDRRQGRKDAGGNSCGPLLAMGAFSLFGLFKKEEINNTVVKIHQARIAHEELKFEEAERLYHEALDLLIEDRKGMALEEKEFLEKRTVIINGLANLALISGRIRVAEELFKDCMKGMILCGMEQTDNAIVECSLKISNVYAQQKRFAEAMAGYKFCVRTQEKKLTDKEAEAVDVDTLALYGLSLDNYARFLISRKEFAEAEKCLKQALVVSEQLSLMGEEAEQITLVILNNLATLFLHRNDYDNAQKNMERAVSLAEKAKLPELAAYYCNLGSIYVYKSRFDEAAKLCQMSKSLAAKRKDSETVSMADLCLQEIDTQKKKLKKK
ncbi:tetratricopeptide repeat protein 19, mitochondrial-like [Lineus longissimus]|uniref:tetratricopeptide repeat protein 19, mitochondrial-like n=1 Tax=Lineus longissimus TaxID=88925 RepID=UPI002B4E753C